jgi:hypothetical protein
VDDGANGPYNVAADPIIDAGTLADILGTRPMTVPPAALRAALGVGWRLRLVPADEAMLDLFLNLPILDSSRIRRELGWSPRHTGVEALREMLDGLAEGAGGPTPPLQADRSTPSRR